MACEPMVGIFIFLSMSRWIWLKYRRRDVKGRGTVLNHIPRWFKWIQIEIIQKCHSFPKFYFICFPYKYHVSSIKELPYFTM